MRQAMRPGSKGSNLAGSFPHCNGITGNAIAGVGSKIPTNAATCHQQAIHILGD